MTDDRDAAAESRSADTPTQPMDIALDDKSGLDGTPVESPAG